MAPTFEQFLRYTNAEEKIVEKMKEAGPRIYKINYDRRFKHCKLLYKKFLNIELRDKTFRYGLVLKPMPSTFKAKFLEFPKTNNNEGETTDTAETQKEQETNSKSPRLEDKYKNDLPSTSSSFVHKPRILSPSKEKRGQTKAKPKTNLKQNPTRKCSNKTRKSLEKQNSSKKSTNAVIDSGEPKITQYFTSNPPKKNLKEQQEPKSVIELLKRKSDPSHENIEIEPQTKRSKVSSVKEKETEKGQEGFRIKVGPLCSKRNLNEKPNKDKSKTGNKTSSSDDFTSDGKQIKNKSVYKPKPKSKITLHSEDMASDDCDINTNNSIVDLLTESSQSPRINLHKKLEYNSSPSKSALPKRNKTEKYEQPSITVSKNQFEGVSPTNAKKSKKGLTKNEIDLWMEQGQKALEQNEGNIEEPGAGERPNKQKTFKEDVTVGYHLQTIRTHPVKVKKYIKYLLKFEKEMRKGIISEAMNVNELSRDKFVSIFNKMAYEDFKNLINSKKYISHWTATGKSLHEIEQKFKAHYTAFIKRKCSWPDVHIELAKLQSYLQSKGIKESIHLKVIPPRILSFDEVLEKTNIKEFISLRCQSPPESYTILLSLCKIEYEKCCNEGTWTDGLKLKDKKEESGSTQEMSMELFTEPAEPTEPPESMSTPKVTLDSESDQTEANVIQKKLTVLQNIENKECPSNEHNEFENSSSSKTGSTVKKRKPRKCGPKSRRKHSSRSDDDLEIKIIHIVGADDEATLKKTVESTIEPKDTQELSRMLTHSQTEPPHGNTCDVSHIKSRKSTNTPARADSMVEKVLETIQKELTELQNASHIQIKPTLIHLSPNIFSNTEETITKSSNLQITPPSKTKNHLQTFEMDSATAIAHKKSSVHPSQSIEKEIPIPKSPNLFQSSGESESKNVDRQSIEVQTLESVYVSCEHNNDFHTEQNNFSLSITAASENEDPFGDVTLRRTSLKDASCVAGSIENTNNNLETSLSGLNVSDAEQIKETTTAEEEFPETPNINKHPKNLISAEPLSNPSTKSSDIVVLINTSIVPITNPSTSANNLGETAYTEGKENTVTKSQSVTSTTELNTNELIVSETVKKLPSIGNVRSQNVQLAAENPKESSTIENQIATKVIEDHNKIFSKDAETCEKIDKTNPLAPVDSDIYPKVVVKREIFSETFSQYDNDVQIIDLPQSEAINIDDEETAPELLETLLCSSPYTQRPPMTIVHNRIANLTPSSIDLDNFPQAQQLPSNFDLTQSQSNLSQSINKSTYESSQKEHFHNVNRIANAETTLKNTDNIRNLSDCQKFKQPHKKTPNLNCFENLLLKKSPSFTKAMDTNSDRCKKTLNNKLSKSKDDLQLSKEISETSFISVAPQNIPSEIEFTQTSLIKLTNQGQTNNLESIVSSEESASASRMEKVSHISKANKRKQIKIANTQESAGSMIVCVSESFSESNQNSMNLEQLKNTEDITKKCLKSSKILVSKIPTTSKRKQNKIANTQESGLSMMVCVSESFGESNQNSMNLEQSKNTEENTNPKECLKSNKTLISTESQQKTVMDAFESTKVKSELSGNDEEYVVCKKVGTQPITKLAKVSLNRSSDAKFLKESGADRIGIAEDAVPVEISHNKIQLEGNAEHDRDDVICLTNSIEKHCEVPGENEKQKGTSSNFDVEDMDEEYVERLLEELLQENEEENVDAVAQPSNVSDNLSNSLRGNSYTEIVEKSKHLLCEADSNRDKRTVEEGLFPKFTTNTPANLDLISDTNELESCEVNAQILKESEDQSSENTHIKKSTKPLQLCKVRLLRENFERKGRASAKCVEKDQTNLQKSIKNTKYQKKEEAKMSNLISQPSIELIEKDIKQFLSNDCASKNEKISKSVNSQAIERNKDQNLKTQCQDHRVKELNVLTGLGSMCTAEHTNSFEPKKSSEDTCKSREVDREEHNQEDHTSFTDNIDCIAEEVTKSPKKQSIEFEKSHNLRHLHPKAVLESSMRVLVASTSDSCEHLDIHKKLSTKSPEKGILENSKVTEDFVSKNDNDTILPKTTKENEKSQKKCSLIHENPKDKADSFESFPSEDTNELINSKVDIHIHVIESSCEHSQATEHSEGTNKVKNTSEDETYSQSFGRINETTPTPVITSTQLEHCDSNEKNNNDKADDSSVEFIDFSFYASSDDNDGENKEEKFSHTEHFKKLVSSKNNITKASKTGNYQRTEEVVENVNEGAECVLAVNVPSVIQSSSIDILKDSKPTSIEASKIISNTIEAERFSNESLSVKPKLNTNMKESSISTIANDCVEHSLKTDHQVLQNTICSNNSSVVELIESSVEDSESNDCDPENEAMNNKDQNQDQENPQLSKNLQYHSVEENITADLNIGGNKENTQAFINTQLTTEHSPERIQSCSPHEDNASSFNKNSKNKPEVMKISKFVSTNKRTRTMSEQQLQKHPKIRLSSSQPSILSDEEVPQSSHKISFKRLVQKEHQQTIHNPSNNFRSTNVIPGFIPIASLHNTQNSTEEFVEVPLLIEKRLLNIFLKLPTSEPGRKNPNALMVNVEVKPEQTPVFIEYPITTTHSGLKRSTIPQTQLEDKVQKNSAHRNSPKKTPIQLTLKAKTKMSQPANSKKKTSPKKSLILPDFVPNKAHAFPSLPLAPCKKPPKCKLPSLMTVEECDYLIEDASQLMVTKTASQILGTDCTYFENSELLRNLDNVCIPHHPEIPELERELPAQVSSSPPTATTCKVINFIPLTVSEGVTARKVWHVNLQWRSQKAMSIEVRFSVNKRSMTVCDESAKLLFTFAPAIWSDVHRVLKEIDHFEYKRITLRNQRKTTSLHKVLRQLFDSSTQVVVVKLIDDRYNPYAICQSTIPVYRKPFDCLANGIPANILNKMKLLKETLLNNNSEQN